MKNKFFRILWFILLFWFLFVHCRNTSGMNERRLQVNSPTEGLETLKMDLSHFKEENQKKQVHCDLTDCVQVHYDEYSELDEKLQSLMEQKAGRILIPMRYYDKKMSDEEIEPLIAYLREITKREGKVSIEPYYIGERSIVTHVPIVKDVVLRGYDIYERSKNAIKYKNTIHYNAKVLYHPKTYNIMMFFFVHKNYGDVCDTIYSGCKVLEYLNDETFDRSLSDSIRSSIAKKQPIKIVFNQTEAKLPEFKIELDNLKEMNRSARIYKWLVAAKETKKKKVVRERFLGVGTIVSLIDYSMTAYDLVQQYILYKPAFQTKVEVFYTGNEKGGNIESVVFTPISDR